MSAIVIWGSYSSSELKVSTNSMYKFSLHICYNKFQTNYKTKSFEFFISNSISETEITTVAVCAGSGSSVLSHAGKTDLWITGEMSHHEALDAHQNGTSVLLAEHSNTERGFLPVFREFILVSYHSSVF